MTGCAIILPMINADALAVYRNKPARVKEMDRDKIVIVLSDGAEIKVREKDIEIIHPGPAKGAWNSDLIRPCGQQPSLLAASGSLKDAWELLLAEGPVSLKELAELAFDGYSPASAWAAYCLLQDGLYFTGTVDAVIPRQQELVEADEKKRAEKQQASGERDLFLDRLRNGALNPDDRRFMQDIEALAYGKSGKSRTMKDLGLGETTEDAHALLLKCGFWTGQINPHPGRFGVSLLPVKHIPGPPLPENRCDLTHLAAFAIDSPWSHDPDDAVSLENDGRVLYVHVADPSASVTADSPSEREARDRGATLYIPEGSFRMLADEALPLFALGLAEQSPALTFKITLNDSGEIESTEIFPSTVKVLRLTYENADRIISDADNERGAEAVILRDLCSLAERNYNRRRAAGAVNIDLPEIHISLNQGQVSVDPIIQYRSAEMVRECMLLAGEGAGLWAMQHNIPFPYIGQEIAELPEKILPGMAGSYQLRRCMRPRLLSLKPGRHEGLGLFNYTQVTSPLRRYTDLLAHIQIRACIQGGPLPPDEAAARIAAGEAAAAAVAQAERASRSHWIMVYLSGKMQGETGQWDAVALEKKGNRWAVMIPALALETQVSLRKDVAPNEPLRLLLKSVNIPAGEAVFITNE